MYEAMIAALVAVVLSMAQCNKSGGGSKDEEESSTDPVINTPVYTVPENEDPVSVSEPSTFWLVLVGGAVVAVNYWRLRK